MPQPKPTRLPSESPPPTDDKKLPIDPIKQPSSQIPDRTTPNKPKVNKRKPGTPITDKRSSKSKDLSTGSTQGVESPSANQVRRAGSSMTSEEEQHKGKGTQLSRIESEDEDEMVVTGPAEEDDPMDISSP